MSEPKAEREIMDVLSSIRRLVSEDRRVKPALLAERVEPVLTPPAPVNQDASPTLSLKEEVAGSRLPTESRFVLTAALRVDAEADASEDETMPVWGTEESDLPSVPQASLEATIAELEAAVAEIEADFEPDGGDDAPEDMSDDLAPAWIAPQAPSRSTGEYHGIIAGFDGLAPPDDRLDLPIAGDMDLALPPLSTDWRSAVPHAEVSLQSPAYTAASFQHVPVAARLEKQREAEAGPAAVPAKDVAPSEEGGGATAIGDEVREAPVPFEPHVNTADRQDEGSGDEEAKPEAHISASRPTIFRNARDELDGSAQEEAPLTAEDLSADADDAADDLFDPLAGSDIDMAVLRDMVAEIVRDELRGTLGERITRNLRALVRREIARALEAEGLTKD